MSQFDPALPEWLLQRLQRAGGSIPFSTFMDWVLHDPEHGAYGSGRLAIGPRGDFVTSPSLGPDFAALLLPQLIEWLEPLLASVAPPRRLALVETGPGEGVLAQQLSDGLLRCRPELAERCELVLVEPNPGMAQRQRQRLSSCPLPVRWCSFEELAAAPVMGVMLAHEVLDALAVERICSDGDSWRRQRVQLVQEPPGLLLQAAEPLSDAHRALLTPLQLEQPGVQRPQGWTSELHTSLQPWMAAAAAALERGVLLVIDYAMEAWRYYSPARSQGTLMAYRAQEAITDPLLEPGHCDLTAHLCIDQLDQAAAASGWQPLGQARQGQALLALGLAGRLHGLQHDGNGADLAALLGRREALLRLVDPTALGDFRWLAYGRGPQTTANPPAFLREPPL